MAGIDHTIIRYQNGKGINFTYPVNHEYKDGDYEFQNEKYIFYCDRDGCLTQIKDKYNNINILPSSFNKNTFEGRFSAGYHCEDFIVALPFMKFKPIRRLSHLLKLLGIKKVFKEKDYEYRYYKTEDFEIFLKTEPHTNTLFIFTEKDSFVSLGGYGHYENPYVHFYNRGYGEDFETKMLKECYRDLCEGIFDEIAQAVFPDMFWDWDYSEERKDYHKKLCFKAYRDMTEEEQQKEEAEHEIEYRNAVG